MPEEPTNTPTNQTEPAGVPPLPEPVASTLAPVAEDPVVEQAVDDITAQEADQLLAAQDAELAGAFEAQNQKPGLKTRIANFLKAWWANPKARYATLAGIAALVLLIAAIPPSRYFVLNTVGVRASASVTITDQSTQLPLKNVEVTLAGQTAQTDGNGRAKLSGVKLGSTTLVVNRRAFAKIDKKVVVGWGSNPYGNLGLKPTGSQYSFVITDFLSGKGIAKATTSANDAETVADNKGNLVLTVDPGQASPLNVTVKAQGYRDEVVSLNLDDKTTHSVKMVPSAKHSFVSRRSGIYDLYAVDVDGKNEKLLLAGTGSERDDLALLAQPSKNFVALSSSRDTARNKDGYLLTTLNVIDTKTGSKNTVAQAEDIRIIDWIGNKLIFVQTIASASASNPNRQRLVSYDAENNTQKELASSNFFNDIVSTSGNIYYAPSDYNTTASPGFFKTTPEGSRTNVLNKAVWNIVRNQYEQLFLLAGNDWYSHKLGDVTASKLAAAPANQKNHGYRDSGDYKQSIWVDSRDGKGVLLKYDTTAQKDTVLATQSGLVSPVYWLNDSYVVYRIHTDQENADYVLNLDGGQPRKISNVTTTRDVGSWYGN